MSPKEKAVYLYTMFHQRTSYIEVWYTQELLDKFYSNAKECALIAVDEILNDPFYTTTINLSGIYFWQEVKKEIEAL